MVCFQSIVHSFLLSLKVLCTTLSVACGKTTLSKLYVSETQHTHYLLTTYEYVPEMIIVADCLRLHSL